MEAQYRTRNGRLTIKVSAEKQKDLFTAIADVQEVFDSESKCGKCKSENIHFQVRTVDKNDFYELVCSECGAVFAFGQHKSGDTLFPKRRDSQGALLPDGGWAKWTGHTTKQ